jgi:hypothetical protein
VKPSLLYPLFSAKNSDKLNTDYIVSPSIKHWHDQCLDMLNQMNRILPEMSFNTDMQALSLELDQILDNLQLKENQSRTGIQDCSKQDMQHTPWQITRHFHSMTLSKPESFPR